MAKLLPYFKWYPADADTDENYCSMSDAECGFFHRCLNKSWVNGGLPADLDELARLMGRNRKDLDKLWSRVGRCFDEIDGRLYNKRLEEERSYATKKSVSATNAVRTRYERSTNELPRAYGCGSVSVSEKKEQLPYTQICEYPKTHAAITALYQSADVVLTAKIVMAACQAYVSVDDPKIPPPTDDTYADAVAAAIRDANGKQTSPGLFLRTVPVVITNWARNGRKAAGGGGEPRLMF